jgi:hypothetical protein
LKRGRWILKFALVNFEIFHLNNHDKVKQRKVNIDAKSNVGF